VLMRCNRQALRCERSRQVSRHRERTHYFAALLVAALGLNNLAPRTVAATIGSPTLIGSIAASDLPEVSGIVDSRANPDTFWVHNDKGDSARFYAISRSGSRLGTFPLSGAASGDWEDIALGPKLGGGSYLYVGDIGDNNANRPYIKVYRTDEPQSTSGMTIPADSYSTAKLQYPAGPRNAESLFVDPLTSDIYIITKTTTPEIYSVPSSAFDNPDQTTALTAQGILGAPLREPTAADISPDGRFILVRSSKSSTGYLFEREVGQNVADALHGTGMTFKLGIESQGEAIGWAADGSSFFTASESDGFPAAPIFSYAFSASSALLAGDYNNDQRVDAADYVVWRENFGAPAGSLPNDSDGGTIGEAQYDTWKANFGSTLPQTASLNAAALPEPSASVLILLAGAVVQVQSLRRRFDSRERLQFLLR
jgi:hypothetical protein